MPEEIENLMVRDDWWQNRRTKDEDYYNDAPDWYEEED